MSQKIPRTKMQQGIDFCKSNILDFLRDANLIIAEDRLSHAYVFVEFAIEEFGKIMMLKEALSAGIADPVEVNTGVFSDHKGKADKAWKVLDTKYRLIFDEGNFEEGFRENGVARHITISSHNTRCECAFVGFKGSQWTFGCNIKKDRLQKLIFHIEEKVKTI